MILSQLTPWVTSTLVKSQLIDVRGRIPDSRLSQLLKQRLVSRRIPLIIPRGPSDSADYWLGEVVRSGIPLCPRIPCLTLPMVLTVGTFWIGMRMCSWLETTILSWQLANLFSAVILFSTCGGLIVVLTTSPCMEASWICLGSGQPRLPRFEWVTFPYPRSCSCITFGSELMANSEFRRSS
jgi:hypothetical protein